ncbi:MAG: hypothetical protein ABI634_05690 [Acidobacteriota bacterium]
MTVRPPVTHPDDETGVPGLRTWPRVYTVVVISFITWVTLLTLLMRTYS